eukprot:snap_masked-scaffold_33-processed-gene-3.47-mRNA-1 protein AED:1.00 eAED:1.00 QI:0/-1/0/0/-1/1/1/0/98
MEIVEKLIIWKEPEVYPCILKVWSLRDSIWKMKMLLLCYLLGKPSLQRHECISCDLGYEVNDIGAQKRGRCIDLSGEVNKKRKDGVKPDVWENKTGSV